jgi:hypothetical protein
MGVLAKVGATGKGTHYILAGKGLMTFRDHKPDRNATAAFAKPH